MLLCVNILLDLQTGDPTGTRMICPVHLYNMIASNCFLCVAPQVDQFFYMGGIGWPIFHYLHHNLLSLLFIFAYWTKLLEHWIHDTFNYYSLDTWMFVPFWRYKHRYQSRVLVFFHFSLSVSFLQQIEERQFNPSPSPSKPVEFFPETF